MKTARQHILKLYPELTHEQFTTHLVESLMESYAKEHACNFSDWIDDHLNKEPDDFKLTTQKLYDKWTTPCTAG